MPAAFPSKLPRLRYAFYGIARLRLVTFGYCDGGRLAIMIRWFALRAMSERSIRATLTP